MALGPEGGAGASAGAVQAQAAQSLGTKLVCDAHPCRPPALPLCAPPYPSLPAQCDRFVGMVEVGSVYTVTKASLRNKRGVSQPGATYFARMTVGLTTALCCSGSAAAGSMRCSSQKCKSMQTTMQ